MFGSASYRKKSTGAAVNSPQCIDRQIRTQPTGACYAC